jgi:GTP-binding protein
VSTVFLGSFVEASAKLPRVNLPWIAFLGRSNVGKSSLINLLTGSQAARVSKTPGRTQALNLFQVEESWIFGDFPGYGYARVSQETRRQWKTLVENFLTADNFSYAVQVVDARHPGLETDLMLSRWLKHQEIPELIVLNKSDKLNRKERAEAEREARKAFPGQRLLFASASTKEGRHEIRKILQTLNENGTQCAVLTE